MASSFTAIENLSDSRSQQERFDNAFTSLENSREMIIWNWNWNWNWNWKVRLCVYKRTLVAFHRRPTLHPTRTNIESVLERLYVRTYSYGVFGFFLGGGMVGPKK